MPITSSNEFIINGFFTFLVRGRGGGGGGGGGGSVSSSDCRLLCY